MIASTHCPDIKLLNVLLDKYPDIQKQITEAFSNSEHNVSSIVSNILNYLLSGAIGSCPFATWFAI